GQSGQTRRLRACIIGNDFAVLAICGAPYIVNTNGLVPAGADSKPGGFETWAAGTSLRATLQKESPRQANPVTLTDDNLNAGIQLYAKHCAVCHGTAAGDSSASQIAKGENPGPPQLAAHGVEDDPEGWTFWKVKHGIRWSGMPAWKDVLNDRQIWTLALFLKHMDNLPSGPKAAWQAVQAGRAAAAAAPMPAQKNK
ncbi:MAG: c-type cytochrome, partial [Bradyrhizobium sp.]